MGSSVGSAPSPSSSATGEPGRVGVFDGMVVGGHEQVVFCHDPAAGLRAIVAIHSTVLGPSLGGARFYPYACEADALADVLRLSRAMTYKAAAAGLDLGGGKVVIIGDPGRTKSEALLRALARHVDRLGGRYIVAEDVGTASADLDLMHRETRWAAGLSRELGGSGDPSPATAAGVTHAMAAVLEELTGNGDLAGSHIVVAGLGKVGSALARLVAGAGARVTVANRHAEVADRLAVELRAAMVDYDTAHRVPCDLFAPCALGGVLNDRTVGELGCRAVVGSANNQLAHPRVAGQLAEAGVLYAPDYVVNAGGLTNVADELAGYEPARAQAAVARIRATTAEVLRRAREQGITTVEAADRLAEDRIRSVAAVGLPSRSWVR